MWNEHKESVRSWPDRCYVDLPSCLLAYANPCFSICQSAYQRKHVLTASHYVARRSTAGHPSSHRPLRESFFLKITPCPRFLLQRRLRGTSYGERSMRVTQFSTQRSRGIRTESVTKKIPLDDNKEIDRLFEVLVTNARTSIKEQKEDLCALLAKTKKEDR
uniref:Uncharacterized protein n=1 Tax=Steinernema glaseri TaxID=37863 RepID=A0A1I7Y5T0_9BILA